MANSDDYPIGLLRDSVDALTKRVAQLEADRPKPAPDYRRLAYNLRTFQKEAAGEWHPQSQRNFINAYEAAVSAMREATGFYIEGGVDGVLAELDSRANESPDRLALRVSDLEIKRDEFEKRLGDVERRSAPFPRGYGKLAVSVEGDTTMSDALRNGVEILRERDVPSVNSSGADDPAVGSASPRTATSPTISEHNAALALGAISEALNVRISADYMNGFPAIRAWPDGEKPMNTPGYHAERHHHMVDPVLLRRICSAIETAIASHEYQQAEFRAALQPKTKFDKPEVVRETDLPGISERAMVDRMLAAIARATGRVITSTDGDDNVARFAGEPDDRDIALFGAMLNAYKHWNLNDEPWSRPEVAEAEVRREERLVPRHKHTGIKIAGERDWCMDMSAAPRDQTIEVVARLPQVDAGYPRYAMWRDDLSPVGWYEHGPFEPIRLVAWAWRYRSDWPSEPRG